MKILIISLPRSGSTSLMNGLSESLGIPYKFQPFSEYIWGSNSIKEIDFTSEVIVKTLINELPHTSTDIFTFYNELIKKFDKTILLSRKDLVSCAESYGYHLKHSSHEYWHKPYNYTPHDVDKNYYINKLTDLHNNLDLLSKENNIDIDYYEDIFSGDDNIVLGFLSKHNIELLNNNFYSHLNPKNKLRKLDFNNKII